MIPVPVRYLRLPGPVADPFCLECGRREPFLAGPEGGDATSACGTCHQRNARELREKWEIEAKSARRVAVSSAAAEERAAWAAHATQHGPEEADRFIVEEYRPRFAAPAPPPTEREVEEHPSREGLLAWHESDRRDLEALVDAAHALLPESEHPECSTPANWARAMRKAAKRRVEREVGAPAHPPVPRSELEQRVLDAVRVWAAIDEEYRLACEQYKAATRDTHLDSKTPEHQQAWDALVGQKCTAAAESGRPMHAAIRALHAAEREGRG